jgi:acyl carrier protein
MSEPKSTFDTLKGLLVNLYDVDPKIIRPDVAVAELGLDSLSFMEFIFAAEDALSLRLPEDKLDPHQAGLTLGAICKAIDDMRAQ